MKKYKLSKFVIAFISILIVGSFISFADKIEIEKNEELLNSVDGVERINILNILSDLYTDVDNSKAIKYGLMAVELSDWENNVEGSIDAYNNLGYAYIASSDMDNSLKSFRISASLSIENDNIGGYAYSQNGYGLIWTFVGDYQKSINYFENAISLFEEISNQKGVADSKTNLGSVYDSIGAYDKAIVYYQEALSIYEKLKLETDIAVVLNNLGSINMTLGNYESSFNFYTNSLLLFEKLEKKKEMSITLNNIGDFYVTFEHYDEGLTSYNKALEISNELNDLNLSAEIYNNIGFLYEELGDRKKALEYYDNSAYTFDKSGNMEGLISAVNNIGTVHYNLADYESALEYHSQAFELSKEVTYRDGLKSSLKNIAYDYRKLEDFKTSNYYLTLYTELSEQLVKDSIAESFANSEAVFQSEKMNDELIKQKEKIIKGQKERQRLLVIILVAVATLLLIVILLVWVSKERSKSEKLLLNILPKKVADNLKRTGETPPVRYEDVSVYFSDVVGFTNMSTKYDPDALIAELNEIFTMFDNIMDKYQCERIKTIGDAYMAVCGMPEKNNDNARLMTLAAIEIRDMMNKRNEGKEIKWEIRIGINTGRVVGGVVGVKKYIYDVFGDTINTASRMESNSIPMQINVSCDTYEKIKDKFVCREREEIEVKGKGLMKMYFVDSEIIS